MLFLLQFSQAVSESLRYSRDTLESQQDEVQNKSIPKIHSG